HIEGDATMFCMQPHNQHLLLGKGNAAEIELDARAGHERDSPCLGSRFMTMDPLEVFVGVHPLLDPFTDFVLIITQYYLGRPKESAFHDRSLGQIGTPYVLGTDRDAEKILVQRDE